MFGAAANGLYRGPHVTLAGNQVPARRGEVLGIDAAAFVNLLWRAGHTVSEHVRPGNVAVALYHCVGAAEFEGFLRVESGVNAAINDVGSASASIATDFVAAQRVAGVDPDAD